VSGQLHAPAAVPWGKRPRYALDITVKSWKTFKLQQQNKKTVNNNTSSNNKNKTTAVL
jgi:hypothetical protein